MRNGNISERSESGWRLATGAELQDTLPHIWRQGNAELNESHPVLDWRFVCLMQRYFGTTADVLAHSDAGMALLQPYGYGRWTTFLPSQACVGSVLIAPAIDAQSLQDSMHALTRILPGMTTLLSLRKQDAVIAQLQTSHACSAFSRTVYGITTAVDTSETFDSFWQSRSKNLRQSVRRRFRNVEKAGRHSHMRTLGDSDSMESAIKTHAALESSGWKGREGTALGGNDAQSGFYTELLRTFAAEDQATAYQLLFDDDTVASLLTIQVSGIVIVLKTAYDEKFARYAPGRLLDYLFLRSVFDDPTVTVVENFTNASEEDQRWCTSSREIVDWDFFPLNIIQSLIEARRRFRARSADN